MFTKVMLSIVVVLLLAIAALLGQGLIAERARVPLFDPEISPRCFANNERVTCVFTNTKFTPVWGCVRGVVTKKAGAEGLEVVSQPICTGPLSAHETKSTEGYWEKGEPMDLCKADEESYGKHLDWDKCQFAVKPAVF